MYREGIIRRRPLLHELAECRPLQLAVSADFANSAQPLEAPAALDQELQAANPGRALARRIAGLSDFRGSDVRLSLDAPLKPGGWPRAETPANFWRWRVVFAMEWRAAAKEHINILECRAALAALRWRTRQRRFQGVKVLHLLDSAVVIGVLTKRRSASPVLRHLVKRCNAL